MRDNPADRALGKFWEEAFARWAETFGWSTSTIEQREGSPDVLLRRGGEEAAHEVKHKEPMWNEITRRKNAWGLEDYRVELFEAWERRNGVPVYYTVHDWSSSASRSSRVDRLEDWFSADLRDLLRSPYRYGYEATSYFRGKMTSRPIDGTAWPCGCFEPLRGVLE